MSHPGFLEQLEIFSHFTAPQLERFARCASRREVAADTKVVERSEPTRDIYVIERGDVRIQHDTPYGVFGLADLGAGELFGETTFIAGSPRTSDVVTIGEAVLLVASAAALTAAAEEDRRFDLALHWSFWKSLSKKLRQTNDQLSRFFSDSTGPGSRAPTRPPEKREDFRIDLATKRQLFQEQKLSNMEIHFLATLSREVKLEPGQVVFREGDQGTEMYVILEGRVMISKNIPGAGEEALAFLERGSYFGEMALIDKQPRSADARADDGGAVVLAIPRDVVEGILDIEKISSVRLLKILCSLVAERLRELDEKLVGWFILSGGQAGRVGKAQR